MEKKGTCEIVTPLKRYVVKSSSSENIATAIEGSDSSKKALKR